MHSAEQISCMVTVTADQSAMNAISYLNTKYIYIYTHTRKYEQSQVTCQVWFLSCGRVPH